MSIRARVALYAGGLTAAAVLLFGIFLYIASLYSVRAQQDQALARRAVQAGQELSRAGTQVIAPGSSVVPIDLARSSDTFVSLLGADGAVIFSTGLIDGAPPALPASVLANAVAGGHALATLTRQGGQGGVQLRVYALHFASSPSAPSDGYVVAGRSTHDLLQQERGLRNLLLIAAVISLIAGLGAAWFVTGRSLRPLHAIARDVEAIGATGDLERRLSMDGPADEVGQLKYSFNGMIARLQDAQQKLQSANDRLQRALEAQQRFVADASHELRTPLTTVQNNAAFLLRVPYAIAEDRDAALQDIVAESGRMSRLVRDLLTLARADAGYHLPLEPVDLAALAEDVCRQAQSNHAGREIVFTSHEPARLLGNTDALRQLLWVLLDNAVKHTPPGRRIHVLATVGKGTVRLEVADDGSGILEQDLPHLFERFYQAAAARGGGAGLGLSIATWIVAEHHGRIMAANGETGGAVFTVTLTAA